MNSVISYKILVEWSHKPGKMVRVDNEMSQELEEELNNLFENLEREENEKNE